MDVIYGRKPSLHLDMVELLRCNLLLCGGKRRRFPPRRAGRRARVAVGSTGLQIGRFNDGVKEGKGKICEFIGPDEFAKFVLSGTPALLVIKPTN